MIKTVVFGKGELAIKIAAYLMQCKDFELSCVVPSIPEPKWCDSLSNWCIENNTAWIPSGNPEELSGQNYDLGISVYFNKIFTLDQISIFRKLVNIHNSPLPSYRGSNPINWALKNNENFHGVTLHEIDSGVDTGPILNQVKFKIDPRIDEVEDVYRRCLDFGYILFLHSIHRIDELEPEIQDHSLSNTYFIKDSIRLGDRIDFRRDIPKRKYPSF